MSYINKEKNAPINHLKTNQFNKFSYSNILTLSRTPDNFLPYKKAIEFLAPYKLSSFQDYRKLRQEQEVVRLSVPGKPQKHYKEFTHISDFLSIDKTLKRDQPVFIDNRQYAPYSKVLEFIKAHDLKSRSQWEQARKPKDFPQNLNIYKNYGFRSYSILFKTAKERQSRFVPYERACSIVRELSIKNSRDYHTQIKSGILPKTLPLSPHVVYASEGWTSWEDFLATPTFPTWQELTLLVKKNSIKNYREYLEFRDTNKNILLPAAPSKTYKEFVSYPSLFGNHSPFASMAHKRALELLKVVEGKYSLSFDSFSHAEIITILKAFPEGRAILQANFTMETLATIITTHLEQAWALSSQGGNDRRDITYHLTNLPDLPEEALTEAQANDTLQQLLLVKLLQNEKVFLKTIHDDLPAKRLPWLHQKAKELFSLPDLGAGQKKALHIEDLTLAQRYFALQLKTTHFYGNWSKPGSGKTIAALYGFWVLKKKRILIFAGLTTFRQWESAIKGIFGTDTQINFNAYDPSEALPSQAAHFNLVNYEKFGSYKRNDRIQALLNQDYDALVVDESHLVKKNVEDVSFKRESLQKIVNAYRSRPLFHFIMLSATPFINNLKEALSCLQLLEPNLNLPTTQNTEVLHTYYSHFHRLGARFGNNLEINVRVQYIPLELPSEIYKHLVQKGDTILSLERVLAKKKTQLIASHIKKGTIIYTHYVTGIVKPLQAYLESCDYSVAVYTGDHKAGLKSFIKGEVDVLICSRSLLYGFDGLQKRVNSIMVLSAMWTSTEFEQLLGRIHRKGTPFSEINILIPIVKSTDQDVPSWDQLRWNRIDLKRTLLECVLDGRFPDSLEVNKKWLYQEFVQTIS